MAKSIEEKYFEDFGEIDYSAAIHSLWEDHNQYGQNGSVPNWPPTLEQVKKAVKERQDERTWQNDRR